MTLPAAKTDFPKCLYLDQNKWIDLARAHYGRPDGKDFQPALAAVREAVAKGRLVVPMSGIHVMETMAPADESRRRRLAEFMVDVSGNQSILPYMSVGGLEILQAVVRKLCVAPTTSIRTAIVRTGLHFALGGEPEITNAPPALKEHLLALLDSPDTSIRLLVEAGDRALLRETRMQDEAAVQQLEETRRRALADLDDDMRHRVEMLELFTKGEPGAEFRAVLRSLGVTIEVFAAKFASPAEWLTFFHDVPTIDVFVTLSLARDKEASRKIDRNDRKDMAFLSMAVPYANIIVVERFWGGVVQRLKLDERYGTTIITDARALPDVLHAEGCV